MADGVDFVAARKALIDRLRDVATVDARIAARWLQGSLADGSADALSDVDAYVSLADDDFEAASLSVAHSSSNWVTYCSSRTASYRACVRSMRSS
ncbi:MAG: hypothetical protein ACR2PL_24005 [Dehalococcoidia bacterium]